MRLDRTGRDGTTLHLVLDRGHAPHRFTTAPGTWTGPPCGLVPGGAAVVWTEHGASRLCAAPVDDPHVAQEES